MKVGEGRNGGEGRLRDGVIPCVLTVKYRTPVGSWSSLSKLTAQLATLPTPLPPPLCTVGRLELLLEVWPSSATPPRSSGATLSSAGGGNQEGQSYVSMLYLCDSSVTPDGHKVILMLRLKQSHSVTTKEVTQRGDCLCRHTCWWRRQKPCVTSCLTRGVNGGSRCNSTCISHTNTRTHTQKCNTHACMHTDTLLTYVQVTETDEEWMRGG